LCYLYCSLYDQWNGSVCTWLKLQNSSCSCSSGVPGFHYTPVIALREQCATSHPTYTHIVFVSSTLPLLVGKIIAISFTMPILSVNIYIYPFFLVCVECDQVCKCDVFWQVVGWRCMETRQKVRDCQASI